MNCLSSTRDIHPMSAPARRTALLRTISSTGWRSNAERLMVFRTSPTAVCCSSASLVSLNNRAFSKAMTACCAKVSTRSICRVEKGRTSLRFNAKTPTTEPSREQRDPQGGPVTDRFLQRWVAVLRVGQNVLDLNGLAEECHTSDQVLASWQLTLVRHVLHIVGRPRGDCHVCAAVPDADRCPLRFAELCRSLDDRIEDPREGIDMDVLTEAAPDVWRGALAAAGVATSIPRWAREPVPGVAHHEAPIPDDVLAASRRLADELGLPLAAVLLAAHAKVLAALSGEPEVVTGYVATAGSRPLACRLTLDHSPRGVGCCWISAEPRPTSGPARASRSTAPAARARPNRSVVRDRSRPHRHGPRPRLGHGATGGAAPSRRTPDHCGCGTAPRCSTRRARPGLPGTTSPRSRSRRGSGRRARTAEPAVDRDELRFQLEGLAGPRRELPDRRVHELFERAGTGTPARRRRGPWRPAVDLRGAQRPSQPAGASPVGTRATPAKRSSRW